MLKKERRIGSGKGAVMAQLPGGIEITWLGHSTFRVKTPEGKMILIDPWVMNNPVCPDDLKDPGHIDLMLITHGHFDHTVTSITSTTSTTRWSSRSRRPPRSSL